MKIPFSEYHLHKEYLQALLFFGLATLVAGIVIYHDNWHASWEIWMVFCVCALLTISSIALSWKFRKNDKIASASPWDIPVLLHDDGIYFPKKYFFRHSSIAKTRFVPLHAINEVHIKTHPASFVINDNEVIFARYDQNDDLAAYARKHGIPVSERLDIWESICDPYLDTEFDDEQIQNTISRLDANGVPPFETEEVRKKIRMVMSANYMAWEWVYLGQFDYLRWGGATFRKRYWWGMELALRNYRNDTLFAT